MSGVEVVMATGDPAIVVDSISVEDDRICVRGRLLGTMHSSMYVGPKELLGLAGLALRGSVWLYLLLLPFICLRKLWRKPLDRNTRER
ncbi:MAG: hypothetical protein Q7R39_09095 [Dehalococcoidia bacterium]|nr:hypothetical protein [Dehalococcoidia bacterium]